VTFCRIRISSCAIAHIFDRSGFTVEVMEEDDIPGD
jgi:hypothetical protein